MLLFFWALVVSKKRKKDDELPSTQWREAFEKEKEERGEGEEWTPPVRTNPWIELPNQPYRW